MTASSLEWPFQAKQRRASDDPASAGLLFLPNVGNLTVPVRSGLRHYYRSPAGKVKERLMDRTSRNGFDLTSQHKNADVFKVAGKATRRRPASLTVLSFPSEVVPDVQVVYVYPN